MTPRCDVDMTRLPIRRPKARCLECYGVPLTPGRDAMQVLPRGPHGNTVGVTTTGVWGDDVSETRNCVVQDTRRSLLLRQSLVLERIDTTGEKVHIRANVPRMTLNTAPP